MRRVTLIFMLHIQHVLKFLDRRHYPFRFNARIHERLPRISQEYLSTRHWTSGGEAHGGLPLERKQGEKSNRGKGRARGEGGQSSQSLGHSQYGSLWCNRDAEAPCFCAFGERSRPSDKPASIPPSLAPPDHLSLAGSWTISRPIFSV